MYVLCVFPWPAHLHILQSLWWQVCVHCLSVIEPTTQWWCLQLHHCVPVDQTASVPTVQWPGCGAHREDYRVWRNYNRQTVHNDGPIDVPRQVSIDAWSLKPCSCQIAVMAHLKCSTLVMSIYCQSCDTVFPGNSHNHINQILQRKSWVLTLPLSQSEVIIDSSPPTVWKNINPSPSTVKNKCCHKKLLQRHSNITKNTELHTIVSTQFFFSGMLCTHYIAVYM